MITFQKMERLMGKETTINFENGIFLDKRYKTIVVGKIVEDKLEWLDTFEKLSEKDCELLVKMIRSRKIMHDFNLQFHLQPETTKVQTTKTPKHYES